MMVIYQKNKVLTGSKGERFIITVYKHWNRLSRKIMENLSLDNFRTRSSVK